MSGLAIIYNLDGRPVDPSLLERMLAAIAHRGPDGMGRWIDGPVAMGHAMLHTTPESTGERQPLRDQSLALCLSFDGRVDNREELAAALARASIRLEGESDAELVLRAYQCWGTDSPQKILGDFGFALWDGRRRRLLCARDPLGTKPVYYYSDARTFVCGSELQQVLEHREVRREPNEAMVAEYLTGSLSSRDQTLFNGVMRLEPGSLLVVQQEGVSKRTYFNPQPRTQIRYRSSDQYAAHLLELIREAVRCRMRSVGGVAAQLSGGLDSSSVVAVAQTLMRDGVVATRPFETFSVSFAEPESDERQYVDDMVGMWRLVSNLVPPRLYSLESCLEQVRRYKEMPVYPSAEMMDSLSALVRAKGLRVCLTGLGGDEWQAAGSSQYADLLRRLRLRELAQRLRSDARLARLDRVGYYSTSRFLLKYALWPLVPEAARQVVRSALRPRPFPQWLEPEFVRRTQLVERTRFKREVRRCPTLGQQERYQTLTGATLLLPVETMERSAAQFGFEVRHPLHDLRIIEFALATPDEQLRKGELEKFVLRGAMRGLVPETILARCDKADFTHVVIRAFENFGGEKVFDSLAVAAAGWVNAAQVRSAYRDMISLYRNGDVNYCRHTWSLFGLFGAEMWFRSVLPARC